MAPRARASLGGLTAKTKRLFLGDQERKAVISTASPVAFLHIKHPPKMSFFSSIWATYCFSLPYQNSNFLLLFSDFSKERGCAAAPVGDLSAKMSRDSAALAVVALPSLQPRDGSAERAAGVWAQWREMIPETNVLPAHYWHMGWVNEIYFGISFTSQSILASTFLFSPPACAWKGQSV